jgi:hypothetical protein
MSVHADSTAGGDVFLRTVVRPAFAPGRARRGWIAMLLTAMSTLSGCYRSVPVESTPAPGATLVLDLNDRGRLTLGDSIGPSASRIEGVLAASSESSYVLRVASVQYLNGQFNRWSGEPLTIRNDLIGRARERQFSRSRTILAGVGLAAAVAALLLVADLNGSGTLSGGQNPPPPIGQ